MKKTIGAFALGFFLAAAPPGVRAQQAGDWGAGAVLGYPTGVTGKWWLSRVHAMDAGLGFADDMVLYGDYWWHGWDVFPQPEPGRLDLRLGAGPRLRFKRNEEFGLRFMAGVGFWPSKQPLELFVEAGPVFVLAPDTRAHVDAGVGLRFYFKGPATASK